MKLSEAVLSKIKVWKIAEWILFVAWIGFILWMTLLSRRTLSTRKSSLQLFLGFRKLITGDKHGLDLTIQYLKNIALFIPFGFFFPNKRNWWIPTFCACAFSTLIELIQYVVKLGEFELDDIIANTLGAFIGVGIALLIRKLLGDRKIV